MRLKHAVESIPRTLTSWSRLVVCARTWAYLKPHYSEVQLAKTSTWQNGRCFTYQSVKHTSEHRVRRGILEWLNINDVQNFTDVKYCKAWCSWQPCEYNLIQYNWYESECGKDYEKHTHTHTTDTTHRALFYGKAWLCTGGFYSTFFFTSCLVDSIKTSNLSTCCQQVWCILCIISWYS